MNWSEHCAAIVAGEPGFPIVEVTWTDAVDMASGWSEDVTVELRLTTTVGYLVKETDEAVALVSIINTEHVSHGIVIPKASISNTRVL